MVLGDHGSRLLGSNVLLSLVLLRLNSSGSFSTFVVIVGAFGCWKQGNELRVFVSAMALSIVRAAFSAIKEKGLGGAFRAAKEDGYFAALLDGNLANEKFRIDGVKLIGTDSFGNKYYEKTKNVQYGRHRWVVFKDKLYNASSIPPEWHGWLHHITDRTPEQLEGLKPSRYGIEHSRNRTGEGEQYIYHAKGHALNPKQRDWKRYEEWTPAD